MHPAGKHCLYGISNFKLLAVRSFSTSSSTKTLLLMLPLHDPLPVFMAKALGTRRTVAPWRKVNLPALSPREEHAHTALLQELFNTCYMSIVACTVLLAWPLRARGWGVIDWCREINTDDQYHTEQKKNFLKKLQEH
eukprot:204661-Amphidinium_carterae.1